MKICLVSHEYPPETGWGGIGTYNHELAHGLATRGHEIHVVCRSLGSADSTNRNHGITVHRIRPKISLSGLPVVWRLNQYWEGYRLAVLFKLTSLFRSGAIDCIESPALHGETVIFQRIYRHFPTVIRIHSCAQKSVVLNRIPLTRALRKSFWYERNSVELATLLTAPSHAIVNDNQKYLPISDRAIEVIANPIDPTRYDRPDLSDQNNPPIVLYVGRLTQRKGAHTLGLAMKHIWQQHPNVQFWFAGQDGTSPTGGCMRDWIINQAPAANREMIRFLGFVEREWMPALYKQATLVAFPSLWEPFGYISLEAMAARRPIVATRSGGPEEVVDNGETGLLVPPNDEIQLAEAINTLLDSPQRARQMGINGRQVIEERYHTRVIAAKMEKVFQSIVK